MELTAYLNIFRRWSWLIALMALVVGSLSFISSRTQTPLYRASSTIQIGSSGRVSNPGTSLIVTEVQLAQTYAVIAKMYPVLEGTVNQLQLPFSPDALKGIFTTEVIKSTSLLVITVSYSDAVVVSDIANALADQLILNSPTNLTEEQKEQIRQLNEEIGLVADDLASLRIEQQTVNDLLRTELNSDERGQAEARRNTLRAQITEVQSNYSRLQDTLARLQQEGDANVLTVVERARIPTLPINTASITQNILAAIVGGMIAAGIAFLLEYMNDTIRNPSEVTPLLGVPLLGSIAPYGKKGTYKEKLITWAQPRSTISEGYRALRVNLMYMNKDKERRVYVVTSPNPEEGKSVTTANLAVTFANTGMRVLLIDADMRRPTQHHIFGLANNAIGLADVLRQAAVLQSEELNSRAENGASNGNPSNGGSSRSKSASVMIDLGYSQRGEVIEDTEVVRQLLEQVIRNTEVEGLDLISSGPTPTNPNELLGSVQIQAVVQSLLNDFHYDVVLFDTPPVLTVSDSSVLANVVDANVVLVVEAARTHRGAAIRAAQAFLGLGVHVAGIVLNRLNPRDLDSGYGYYYYYGYYGYGSPNDPRTTENTRPMPAPARGNRNQ
jgi:polysaccharide biosynthesis transport protein